MILKPEKHIHHIQPRYLIGEDNSPDNLTPPISIALHAALHKDLFEHLGNTEDFIAWKNLLGLSLKGCVFTPELRQKISNGLKGHIVSEKSKLKNSKSHKGKKASLETKRKMSISQLGNKNGLGTKRLDIKEMSERQKGCKNSMYGKHHTKETKEKISKMGKGRIAWNKGIPHSKKTKKKISESLKRRKK